MGLVYHETGNYTEAIVCFEKAIAFGQQIGYKEGVRAAYGNMGIIYDQQGNFEKAIECYQKNLELSRTFAL